MGVVSREDLDDKITYQFFIPQDIDTKYKNKDISGQNLLDNSIILMDDERVEFKLQKYNKIITQPNLDLLVVSYGNRGVSLCIISARPATAHEGKRNEG